MATNKGKKYFKLQGGETATPEAKARARAFMGWYGLRFDHIRKSLIYAHKFDDEIATDTALAINDAILLKGLIITGKYKWYFLRAYHTNYVAAAKRAAEERARVVDLEEVYNLEAPEYDAEAWEAQVDKLRAQVLDYVRAKYEPAAVSLFEIYVELHPEISYKKLADMLGLRHQKVWTDIGEIKRDVVAHFGAQKDFLLSVL